MKKIITIALLAIGMTASAQLQFGQKEYFTGSVYVDPSASIKEGGINAGAEIELVSYFGYVKAGVQTFDSLEGGYFDISGALGLNLTSGLFEQFRYYGGIRLGVINRGYKDSGSQPYPLFGFESGIDYNVSEKYFVGLRGTADYREDFLYSGASPEYRLSGFIRAGFKF